VLNPGRLDAAVSGQVRFDASGAERLLFTHAHTLGSLIRYTALRGNRRKNRLPVPLPEAEMFAAARCHARTPQDRRPLLRR
jgi:hypothetical protein